MKKCFLYFFLLLPCVCFSQTPYTGYIPFPEDSAQWSEWSSGFDSIGNFYTVSTQYKMKGDTILNGISYNKIYKSFDLYYGANDTVIHSFVRQDISQKKVFIRYPYSSFGDTSDYLLYDFSLQDQDTFYLKLIADGQFHRFKIDGDNITQFNFDFRREIGFYPIDTVPPTWGIDCDNPHSWTEGMGNWLHPFYIELAPDTCRSPSIYFFNLECFWHNGQYVSGGTFCDYSTGLYSDFIGSPADLLVYPNPASAFTTLNIAGKNIQKIVITDLAGKSVIPDFFVTDRTHVKIDTKDLRDGSYIINAYDPHKKLFAAKLMIIKK